MFWNFEIGIKYTSTVTHFEKISSISVIALKDLFKLNVDFISSFISMMIRIYSLDDETTVMKVMK